MLLPKLECYYDSAAGLYVCNTEIKNDSTLSVYAEILFACETLVTLPRSREVGRDSSLREGAKMERRINMDT